MFYSIVRTFIRGGVLTVLFLIAYGLKQESERYSDFFEALDSLGQCLEICPGVTLCYSLVSAAVIASELRPYLCGQDRLVVTQMYRGHCAGLLNGAQKNMIRLHISQDPAEAMELPLPRRVSRAARRSGAL